MSGIAFALNYPTEFELIRYDPFKKVRKADAENGVYMVRYLEGGTWHYLPLAEAFVRSCMTTAGPKSWVKPLTTRYEDVFI
jgi:hypothetical protein